MSLVTVATSLFPSRGGLRLTEFLPARKQKRRVPIRCVRASAEHSSERIDGRREGDSGGRGGGGGGGGFTSSTMEVTTFDRSFGEATDQFPVWEKIGAVVRLSYGIGQFF